MLVRCLPSSCMKCGQEVAAERRALGYKTCLVCGEREASMVKHCVVPMHKSGLVVITPDSKDLLTGIGEKGGQVR